jgi:hypothetical protein
MSKEIYNEAKKMPEKIERVELMPESLKEKANGEAEMVEVIIPDGAKVEAWVRSGPTTILL